MLFFSPVLCEILLVVTPGIFTGPAGKLDMLVIASKIIRLNLATCGAFLMTRTAAPVSYSAFERLTPNKLKVFIKVPDKSFDLLTFSFTK